MRFALLAVSLSLLTSNARPAVVFYESDPEIHAKTNELLAEKNINYRELAENRLKGNGHFDRQRVEITGMLAADDTRRIDPGDFDDYIKPSVNADKKRTIGDWIRSRGGYKPDVKEMEKSMRGEMTEHTIKTVAPFKNMEINEIVAHSWGSEMIYAAILNGEMRPPKKLIVLGVPDDDRAKWSMLAERTGTEVLWGRADNDAAALDKGVKLAKEAAKDIDFKAKWDAACTGKKKSTICLPHGRGPRSVAIIPVGNLPARPPLFLAHDRADYYDRVRKDFFKGTAHQLKAADNKLVVKEMAKLEEETVTTTHAAARELVQAARAQIAIAHRDSDNRLRDNMADIAVRACTAPESVNQAELDALQEPYDADFVNVAPSGVADCFAGVYRDLRRGVALVSIRNRAAAFAEPVDARPAQPPLPAQPVDALIRPSPFALTFPDLAKFAIDSCRSPGSASPVPMNYYQRPYEQFYGARKNWEGRYTDQLALLDGCPKLLFIDLVSLALEGRYWKVDERDWIKNQVARHSPSQGGPESPGDRNTQPPSGGDPCRDNHNIRCP